MAPSVTFPAPFLLVMTWTWLIVTEPAECSSMADGSAATRSSRIRLQSFSMSFFSFSSGSFVPQRRKMVFSLGFSMASSAGFCAESYRW